MEQPSPSVADALACSGAELQRSTTIGRGLSLAEWSNRDTRTHYDHPNHHTLSLYLAGGERVVREDLRLSGGAPDKLCLLPAGHESRWRIGGPLRLFHLYIEPETLAYRALTAFDLDPRRIDLRDATFADDPAMAAIVRGGVMPLDWTEPGERSALDAACHLLVHRLLRQYVGPNDAVRGGLSPATRRRIADLIEAHLDEPLTLDRLAAEARLNRLDALAAYLSTLHPTSADRSSLQARLLEAVSRAYDGDIVMIDSSCVCVHQHGAAGKKGGLPILAWDVQEAA